MSLTAPYPIQEFLNYLTFQKRYSKHTITSYQNDLTHFFDFISVDYNTIALKDISASMVRTWLASLKENKAASKTVNRKISTLKSFFKYQLKMQQLEVSPMVSVSALKVNRRLPSFVEEKDLIQLLQNMAAVDGWEGKLNSLILQMLYQTGIRRSELINLKEQHIDRSDSNIKILGKGNKERRIPVGNHLLNLIDEFIAEKKIQFADKSDPYLLVTKKGKRLYPEYVYNIVKRYLSGGHVTNEKKSPHVLRHSFATHLTNHGAEINAIKELLGHSSLAATQIYTHNSIEKLKEVHKLAHPKS